MMIYLKKIINIDQLPKMWSVQTTLRTPSSNWSLRVGDVPCWICRSVYRSEFTDASRVCSIKPRNKFPPQSYLLPTKTLKKPSRRIDSAGQVDPALQRPLLELCLFCQSVTKKKKFKKKKNVSVVYLHAFRFCLKENDGKKKLISSLLHLAIADNRKPYRSSAETPEGGKISFFF